MKKKLIIVVVSLVIICAPSWAQGKKTANEVSNAEKMLYSRTNKYWGPGTYYCYAPGKPLNKMADNSLAHMRDLTGISQDDCVKELTKQGFTELAKTKKKTWYKPNKNVTMQFFTSPDKSYILRPDFEDLYNSPTKADGKYEYATKSVIRLEILPLKDSLKVIDAIWKFTREVRELKAVLGTFGSKFKKSEPKAYPIQMVATGGWTGLRAGTWLLRNDNGKLQGVWEKNENILRRTIGKPEFHFVSDAWEPDFCYILMINLTKEGFVLEYTAIASTIANLEPGNTWVKEYPNVLQVYKNGITADKNAIDLFKKAPFPPVLYDLDEIIHSK
ncbi:MAG: hypothetical protein PHS59_11090 [Paludibacter sp.]|nr:hypothetical protein [Paludibacter sp.]